RLFGNPSANQGEHEYQQEESTEEETVEEVRVWIDMVDARSPGDRSRHCTGRNLDLFPVMGRSCHRFLSFPVCFVSPAVCVVGPPVCLSCYPQRIVRFLLRSAYGLADVLTATMRAVLVVT